MPDLATGDGLPHRFIKIARMVIRFQQAMITAEQFRFLVSTNLTKFRVHRQNSATHIGTAGDGMLIERNMMEFQLAQ